MLLRLGLGASANIVQTNEITSQRENADVSEARDDLETGAEVPVLAAVDVGLGYQF